MYEEAVKRIEHIFDTFDYVCVSFSGGKDSTVVLNIACDVAAKKGRLPVDVFFVDEEVVSPDTVDYVMRVKSRPDVNLIWMCTPTLLGNACSSIEDKWIPWEKSKEHLWVRPMPDFAIYDLEGYDMSKMVLGVSHVISIYLKDVDGRICIMNGIRAQESLTRFRSVSGKTEENYIIKSSLDENLGGHATKRKNIWKGMPIFDWMTDDVWTAPKKYGWDYSKQYDKMEMAGIPPNQQRVAPPYGSMPARGLWMWHHTYPELWDKMLDRVHGARTAALYSRTALYMSGNVSAQKPDNMTWLEYLYHEISKLDSDELKAFISKNIADYINTHNKKTNNAPIVENAVHPDTGVSWKNLLTVIVRKDKDGRLRPSQKIVPRGTDGKYEKAYAKYMKEVKETLT